MRPNHEQTARNQGHEKARHIARDINTRGKFHIIGMSEETGMVELHQHLDGWTREFEEYQRIPWTEFVQGLIDGRFEISPLQQPLEFN